MKQKFFLMIALLLVASQGFAQHDGSWSILPGQIDYRENLGSDDGAFSQMYLSERPNL